MKMIDYANVLIGMSLGVLLSAGMILARGL